MMCHYNNIVMKTLSLQVQSQISPNTLQTIFQLYSPFKLGIKESAIYLQIEQDKESDFTEKVKKGAFPQLKCEVFQMLDSNATMQACFQNCLVVLTSIQQIKNLSPNKDVELLGNKQQMNEVSLSTNSFLDKQKMEQDRQMQESNIQYENTILLNPIYEASEVVRINFDDYSDPVEEQIVIKVEGKPQQEEFMIDQKYKLEQQSAKTIKMQDENNNGQTINLSSQATLQNETTYTNTNIDRNLNVYDNYILLVLSLWIICCLIV